MFPKEEDLTICFAHVAYRMAERFAARNTGIRHFQVNSLEELTVRIGDADVLSVSMMWRTASHAAFSRAFHRGSAASCGSSGGGARLTASRSIQRSIA